MKKVLCVLAGLMMVMSFAGSAMAADASCSSCKNASVENVKCTTPQGPALCPFDYDDGNYTTAGGYAVTGYCGEKTNKVIFDVCSCPDACRIEVGQVLGVKIEILTAGVYWALDPNVTDPGTNGSNPANNRLRFSLYPKNSVAAACDAGVYRMDDTNNDGVNETTFSFTSVGYYASNNLTAPLAPQNGCGSVATANKAKVILVDKPGGYVIRDEDVVNNRCQMWIDIPAMIVNAAEYQEAWAGKDIQIRVSAFSENQNASNSITNVATTNILNTGEIVTADGLVDEDWASFSTYLCPDCHSPCGCTVTVGRFCCGGNNYGMLYPYFAPDNDGSFYWNGIAISNLDGEAGTATLWIYEKDGDIGKATISFNANETKSETIKNIQWTVSSKKSTAGVIGDAASYVVVCTTFNADGFAMISDAGGNGISMGYLPRNTHLLGDVVPTVCK